MSRAEVFLHPLVMVNVADHFTRLSVAGVARASPVRAIGAFVGVQEGSTVSVLDSFEMKVELGGNIVDVNLPLVRRKLALTSAAFPRFELLGWYIAGPVLSDAEMLAIHKQVQELNESPLVMVMSDVSNNSTEVSMQVTSSKDKKVLPVTVYETVMHIVNDQPVQSFVELPVKVETTESERVTVDTVVSQRTRGGPGSDESTLGTHMASLKNAVQMLRGRVMVLQRFLQLSKSGQIPVDHELLREAEALCNQLPALEPSILQIDFNAQMADAMVVSLLAALTKHTATVSGMLEKFFSANPTPGVRETSDKSKSKREGAQTKGGGRVT